MFNAVEFFHTFSHANWICFISIRNTKLSKNEIENSFDKPEEVSIKNKTIDNASKDFQYVADKYSVSVIRLKFK